MRFYNIKSYRGPSIERIHRKSISRDINKVRMNILTKVAISLSISSLGIYLLYKIMTTPDPQYKEVRTCDEIKAKQIVTVNVNGFGATEEEYYFLMKSGNLEEVTLKNYMSFKEGDSICIIEQQRIN